MQFTLTAHDGTTGWKDLLNNTGVHWQPWIYSEEELKKAEVKKITLPKIEVTRFYWTPSWSGKQESKLVLPIILKRTWNKEAEQEEQVSLFYNDGFVGRVPVPERVGAMAGEFLPQAQGPDLSARLRALLPLRNGGGESLYSLMPATFAALEHGVAALEAKLRDAVEVEFTVEHGTLWFLSARPGKRSTAASLQIVTDFVKGGVMSEPEALLRIDPLSLDQLLHSTIDPEAKRSVVASGLPASPGALSGVIIFDAEEARSLAADGVRVISGAA